jgi:predicted RNA methylase
VVYSLHKRPGEDLTLVRRLKTTSDGVMTVSASAFMKRFVEENGGRIEGVFALLMTIPRMFDFHTKGKHEFPVDLYVMCRK